MAKHEQKGKGHLYSESGKHDFEKRYGKKKGNFFWGKTLGKVRREQIDEGKLPHKHSFRSKDAAMRLAKDLRKSGRKVKVTVRGIVRKKYTVHLEK